MKPLHGWLQTYSGRAIFPEAPDPRQIEIEDIAHALANVCRFGGHCREFYSVAQHSVLVSGLTKNCPLLGLLHDAAEAYLGDVVRPLKRLLPAFSEFERSVFAAIAARFELDTEIGPRLRSELAEADNILLATEARDLMAAPPLPWQPLPPPLEQRIEPWPPAVARREFLARFEELRSREAA